MDAFLSFQYLPRNFEYPSFYRNLVELNLTNLEPWRILHDQLLTRRAVGLSERYPSRILVPFARRVDSDDIACWDIDAGYGAVSVVHDFANPGWEQKEEYEDIIGWFRKAIEDLIEFEQGAANETP
ncbi:hypothetical protein IRJ34_06755 [Paenarthrobacter sp. GOM3]|uniref:hypothetical protein n=1 Tax=Paenarthrobacter sp. GOM3 TaxID=2782567 RepID=UPI001BAB2299|nr:hypothetical protein [Paenarthrobacter sp. GOM3]WOH20018.1 hypothetical protein IRJ34_06755 [Paenarthrobacter sp. GOM3]